MAEDLPPTGGRGMSRLKQAVKAIRPAAVPPKDALHWKKILYNVQSKLDDKRETVENRVESWMVNLDRNMPEKNMRRWSSSRTSSMSLASLDQGNATDLGFESDDDGKQSQGSNEDPAFDLDPDKFKRLRHLLVGARSVIGFASRWQDQIKRAPALEEVSEGDEEMEEILEVPPPLMRQKVWRTAPEGRVDSSPISYHLWDEEDLQFNIYEPPTSSFLARNIWERLMQTKTFEELFEEAERILAT